MDAKTGTFKFALNQVVKMRETEEIGTVTGRAEYEHGENSYYIRYKAGDGRQVQAWWGESCLIAA